jgi:hypothetical protein
MILTLHDDISYDKNIKTISNSTKPPKQLKIKRLKVPLHISITMFS